jgi:phenylpropionate dioxygenase-like ring-hydroxylating dioxygenase large terminal subunit
MTAFMDDRAVAGRVLGHSRDRTTDRGAEVWREPVAHYRSPERLGREVEVLRRSPAPLCPSAALPEAGSYLAREASGTQLLAVRGDDGRVRVFRNACRHRGTPLAAGSGCAKSFVCPYHAWVYRLDGRLRHVPHEDGFPGLDKEQSGLVPVAAEERLGLVFVTQEADSPHPAPWEGVPELVAPEQQLIDATEGVVEVNWKVYLEGSIEGYHIRPAHKDTFYPYGFDNLNVVELCGRNSRVTYPFRRIEKLAGVAPEDRRVDGLLTYVYHLFPNALVTVLSRHTNLVVLEPLTVDRTKVFNYMLTNPGGGADAAQLAKRDAGFVGQTGAAEDLALVSAIQRSIGSGANEFFTFGHFESAIVHFHRTLAAALDGDASAPGA